jgi:hypothetical protein
MDGILQANVAWRQVVVMNIFIVLTDCPFGQTRNGQKNVPAQL